MTRFFALFLGGLALFGMGAERASAAIVDINGGSSWSGWDHRGNSLNVGIWGDGSTTRSYELYTTVFSFNNNTFNTSAGGVQVQASNTPSGFAQGSFSKGAFTNGNRILGIGMKMNGGSTTIGNTFVNFDLGNDSYQAASALGATDGRVSQSQWGHTGDFSVWMNSYSPHGPSNIGVLKDNGTAQSGTGALTNLVGGYGSGVSYDFAMRMFRNGGVGGSIQMFFDLTAMQDLYGGGPNFINNGWSAGQFPIGAIGDSFRISMYNDDLGQPPTNGNRITFGISSVPEPSTLALLSVGAAGFAFARRRRK